jgi:hypothetical protein
MAGESQQQSSDPRPSTVVVTSENLAEFQAAKLNLKNPVLPKADESAAAGAKADDPAKAKAEGDEALEDERKQEQDPKKQRLNLRFSELTEKRKHAEAERDAAAAEAKREREARLALEERLKAADPGAKGDEAKGKPPADAKPDRAKFPAGAEGDAAYQEAYIDWRADQRIAEKERKQSEERAKEAEAAVKRTWGENQTAIKAVIPDYDAKIAASTAVLSDEMTDAIITMEGEAGPRCLYYFAEFPQEAERIGKLTVRAALRELGKIEEKVMSGKAPKKDAADEAEISKAPAPAKPLKSTSAPESLTTETGDLKPGISYKEYKAARKAGKIS